MIQLSNKFHMIKDLSKNRMYIFILSFIFLKSLLFVGLLGTNNAERISIENGFFSVPPYLLIFNFAMIILSITFLFKGRAQLWALVIVDISVTALFICDIWYYRSCSQFLSMFIFSNNPNLKNHSLNILTMIKPIDILFFLDIITSIFYLCYNKQLYKSVNRKIALFLITLIMPSLYMAYLQYKVVYFQRGFLGQTVFLQSWSPFQTMSSLGPIGYHLYDTYEYFSNSKTYHLTEKDKDDISAWYVKNIENKSDNKYADMMKGKNLLVIQVESLENFVINQKIQNQEVTPTLNKLLKNSLYFDNYHENVFNGVSSDSDLLTNAGVYPIRSGSVDFRYPTNEYEHSLPNVLKKMGYSTTAIHSDIGCLWNWMLSLESIGFENCIDATHFESKNPIGLGLSDKDYLEQIVPMVEMYKQPFYTFLTTQSSHGPFDLPEKYRTLKLDGALDKTIMGDYLQSIHYTDSAIGEFLDDLNKKGILKNTTVVIYGDHTGVHKFYKDEVDAIKPAQSWWLNNDMRIPLIIYNPEINGETIDTVGGQIDIMPTIEYLMGVDKQNYQENAFGKVLLNTDKKYTILEDFTMIGDYSADDENHAKEGINLSDKMVRNNYFKGN